MYNRKCDLLFHKSRNDVLFFVRTEMGFAVIYSSTNLLMTFFYVRTEMGFGSRFFGLITRHVFPYESSNDVLVTRELTRGFVASAC